MATDSESYSERFARAKMLDSGGEVELYEWVPDASPLDLRKPVGTDIMRE